VRKKKVWRYYCDFCSKGGCSGGSIAKHERGCTRNPNRECGMCRAAKNDQRPTAELLAVLESDGVDAVLSAAEGCPACVMAAIHALRKKEPLSIPYPSDDAVPNWIEFDYKAAAKSFWESVDAILY